MSMTPTLPTWFPEGVDAGQATKCSKTMMEVARQIGFRRETYAIALAQMAESLVGHTSSDDIDPEVLRFVAERFRATADAIDQSSH